jgi:lipopolysaccharide export system permease protein
VLWIIDRYIAKLFLFYLVAGLLVFITIFLAADFTSTIVRFDVGMDVIARYYMYYMPTVAYQMVPVACLLATLFTLSNLNRSNELISLFSMGLSLARVSSPILFLVGAISVASFFVGDRVLPTAMRARNYVYFVEMRNRPHLYYTVKQDKIWYRSQNIIFNIGVFNPDKSIAQGLTMYYFDDSWKLIQLLKARTVNLGKESWELKGGSVTLFAEESSFPLTRPFDSKVISIAEDLTDIRTSAPESSDLSLKDLSHYIRKNKEIGLDTTTFEVDYHGKLAFAFSGIVFALLAIPFSTRRERSGGAMMDVGVCAGLALVYWIMFSVGLSIGKTGLLPPFVAAWTPNMLMLGLSSFLILRLKK